MKRYLISVGLLVAFICAGCKGRAELISYRESIHQAVQPMLSETESNSKAIAGVEGYQLPDLSLLTPEQKETWLNSRLNFVDRYNQVYQESKQQDSSGQWFIFGK